MTLEIAFMLVLIVVALLVFSLEIFPIEVTAVGLLGVLLVSGTLTVEQAVSGFSNKAVITIAAMFVLSHALVKTGILEVAADRLSRQVGTRKWLGMCIFLGVAGILSGFLNNTAVVAVFIPLAISLCRRFHLSPSKALIPLSFASMAGGTLTLVGTSTNLIVSSVAEKAGQPAFGMFEFFPLGIVLLGAGLIYVCLLARRLLPARSTPVSLAGNYHMGAYLTEVRVQEKSKLAGKSCLEVGMNRTYDITVLSILRDGQHVSQNIRNERLGVGDILIVRGTVDNIFRLRRELGLALLSDVKLNDRELAREGQIMAEGLVTRTSSLIGKNLRDTDFRQHYRAFVLAVRRHGEIMREKLAYIPLRFSDTLLMLAAPDRLDELRRSEDLIIISEVDLHIRRGRLWWLVLALIPVMVLLAAVGTMEILKGAFLAVVLLLFLAILSPQETYRSIDWSVVVLIASLIPVGEAMIETGTAGYIADQILIVVSFFEGSDIAPYVGVALIYLVTCGLTQVVSNAATAVLMPPVALSLAAALGVDARPFLMATCFAASSAFLTPMGYQTNLMVYAPGNYRFLDFTRFGGPLSLLFWVMATLLIPRFWPF